jgi:hypothetical protein
MVGYRQREHEAAMSEGKVAVQKLFAPHIEAAKRLYFDEVDVAVGDREELFRGALNEIIARGAAWF